jgi:hypothetical protein
MTLTLANLRDIAKVMRALRTERVRSEHTTWLVLLARGGGGTGENPALTRAMSRVQHKVASILVLVCSLQYLFYRVITGAREGVKVPSR